MFTASADIYDLIYGFKNYKEEAGQVAQLIEQLHPQCKTLLDVGCGTGEHHRYLREKFEIDGLDLDEKLLEKARAKNPEGKYFKADMKRFSLEKKYDAVICLFSAIGYLETMEEIVEALKCFKAHLNPGGIILVEPWFTPESFGKSRVTMLTYEKDEIKICRISRSMREGNYSSLNFHYLVGTVEDGVHHLEEMHRLRLSTKEEMLHAFTGAGLEVNYDEKGLVGRGMYISRTEN